MKERGGKERRGDTTGRHAYRTLEILTRFFRNLNSRLFFKLVFSTHPKLLPFVLTR
jgi:hypothetical protein